MVARGLKPSVSHRTPCSLPHNRVQAHLQGWLMGCANSAQAKLWLCSKVIAFLCRYDITSLDKITTKEDVEGERESAK